MRCLGIKLCHTNCPTSWFQISLRQILCCVPISITPNSVSPNSVVHQFLLSNIKFCSIARNSETANSALNLIDGQQNLSVRTKNCKSNNFKFKTLLITTPTPTPSLVKSSLKVDGFSCWQEHWVNGLHVCAKLYCFSFFKIGLLIEDRGTQSQFSENMCSEDDLRSRIFGTFLVKFLACLPLLGFSNI